MRIPHVPALVFILASLPLGAMPASAQTPGTIRDLVGALAAGGETQLEARGWVHIKTDKGDDRAWSYWWQARDRQCISVAVVDGRFDAITSTPAPDCNQSAKSGGSDAAAAAVAGLAVVGIAAALAHKSHHHGDGKHLSDPADSQYERGFRDGLYNATYHNYDRSDDYAQGYARGAEQRGYETDHRGADAPGAAGYAPSINLNDLLTARAAGADTELQRRGFRTINAYQAGETAYTIRSNERTGQCVQVAVTDGRVRYISALRKSACR